MEKQKDKKTKRQKNKKTKIKSKLSLSSHINFTLRGMSSSNYVPSLEVPEEDLYELSKKTKLVGSKKSSSNKSSSRQASVLKSISQPIQRSKNTSKTTESSKASSKKNNLLDIDSLMSESSSSANIKRHAFSVNPITTYSSISKFSKTQLLSPSNLTKVESSMELENQNSYSCDMSPSEKSPSEKSTSDQSFVGNDLYKYGISQEDIFTSKICCCWRDPKVSGKKECENFDVSSSQHYCSVTGSRITAWCNNSELTKLPCSRCSIKSFVTTNSIYSGPTMSSNVREAMVPVDFNYLI